MWHSMLINELLPTLLRPMNAYSGSVGLGHCVGSRPLPRCSAFRDFIRGAASGQVLQRWAVLRDTCRSDAELLAACVQCLRQPLLQDPIELCGMLHHRRVAAIVDPVQFAVR